jgi:hypothetical protein
MSAQDDEIVLVNVDSGQADELEDDMEEPEDEKILPESTQSTWKVCESDIEPPNTPQRQVSVTTYTPPSIWMSVDDNNDGQTIAQPSPPAEEPIGDVDDDNASVFSISHYGSMDWDHTGDELYEMEVTPKITRAYSISPNNRVIFHELPPITPMNKLGSTSSTSTSEIKSSSLKRDASERFAPRVPSPAPPQTSSAKKSTTRRVSTSLNPATASMVRDAHGRFAANHGTPAKRRASVSSSTTGGVSSEQDAKGRFVLKKETLIPVPNPLTKRGSSSSGTPDEGNSIVEDVHYKIAPKQTSVAYPKSSTSKRTSNNPSPEADMDDDGPSQPMAASKPPKAKKAPVKSPYFVPPTPPISPETMKKGKSQKGNRTPATDVSTTPRKDKDDVTCSPGFGKKFLSAKMVSCIPFPPLSAPYFGLIQEKLAHDPFRLLIAVTFLIRTHGKHAIPVFFALMEKYPTPESLVTADKEEIVPIIRHLGLQNQRASTYQMYAKIWLEDPPTKGKRYPVRGYPNPESGRDVKKGEVLGDEDERDAWEIGHMTQGPYAIDSWRIFCRDRLRGEADNWNGEGRGEGFQPEWMRVLPEDKELRAYLRWMWLKEGFEWDPFTGDKEAARPQLMRAAMEGRIAWDDQGGMRILNEPVSASPSKLDSDVEKAQASTPFVRDSEDSDDELA